MPCLELWHVHVQEGIIGVARPAVVPVIDGLILIFVTLGYVLILLLLQIDYTQVLAPQEGCHKERLPRIGW